MFEPPKYSCWPVYCNWRFLRLSYWQVVMSCSHNMSVNTLRPRQNGHHFADGIFKRIFMNENVRILIIISLTFVPKGPINNIQALVQIMAWRRLGDKPLSEPMLVSLLTYICVTRPQWVNTRSEVWWHSKYMINIAFRNTSNLWKNFCIQWSNRSIIWSQIKGSLIVSFTACWCSQQKTLIMRCNWTCTELCHLKQGWHILARKIWGIRLIWVIKVWCMAHNPVMMKKWHLYDSSSHIKNITLDQFLSTSRVVYKYDMFIHTVLWVMYIIQFYVHLNSTADDGRTAEAENMELPRSLLLWGLLFKFKSLILMA